MGDSLGSGRCESELETRRAAAMLELCPSTGAAYLSKVTRPLSGWSALDDDAHADGALI